MKIKKKKDLDEREKGKRGKKKGDFTVARLANKLLREIKIHITIHRKRKRKREGAKGLNRILFGSLTLKT